jgi:plastocyanin
MLIANLGFFSMNVRSFITRRLIGPPATRVKPGTTVTFTNVGDVAHTATAARTCGESV